MTSLLDKLDTLSFFLHNPKLYTWRKRGFNYKQYNSLNQRWIKELGIETVLDIGANTGQSALAFAFSCPNSTIHSFEPLPECFTQLKSLSTRLPSIVAHNYALGNETGELIFEKNSSSASSSLLKMTSNHVNHFPEAKPAGDTKVPVIRLDDWALSNDVKKNLLIKIDVQGFELEVIRGGENTFKQASLIITETSFEYLYERQPLFDEIFDKMIDLGFQYAGSFEQLFSPINGRVLQQDAVFIKS